MGKRSFSKKSGLQYLLDLSVFVRLYRLDFGCMKFHDPRPTTPSSSMKNTHRLLSLVGIVTLVLTVGSPTALGAFAGGVTLGTAGPDHYAILALGGQGS